MTDDAKGLSEDELKEFIRLHTCSNPMDLVAAIEILITSYSALAERLKAYQEQLESQHITYMENQTELQLLTADNQRLMAELDASKTSEASSPEGCYRPGSYMEKLQECIQLERANQRLRGVIEKVKGDVCSYLCPSVKKTGDPWVHSAKCQELQAALTEPPTRGEQ